MKAPERKRHDKPPTVERLRDDIDSGRTGEKVPYPDPAAAPLGSDDEAAGNAPTEQERRGERNGVPRGESPPREAPGMVFLYGLLIVGVALIIIGSMLLLRV